MRVLYLTNNGMLASTTVATKGWFEDLIPKGLQPVVASPVVGEFCQWAGTLGVPSYRVPLPFPEKLWPWPFLHALWRLRRIVRRHRIQLIHCNEHDVYPIGCHLARWTSVPAVCSVQFTLTPGFSTWAFGGTRQPARLFFVSGQSMEASRPAVEGVVPESRWRVLYYGLRLEAYRCEERLRQAFRARMGLQGGDLAIGIGCGLRPVKQIEHLAEVTARLEDLPVRLFLAGITVPGLEDYADKLLNHLRQRLGPRFTFLGQLDNAQLQEMFNGLDLYVNTSLEESFGVSVLESLACGCPVVGYPSISVSEVILPDGGEIVPQNDLDQLTEAVRRWLSDRGRLQAARAQARRQAERFDIARSSEQLWQEYHAVLAEHNGRAS
ncbi:MAG: hypothetical protein C4296_04060 [Gemmataceae bacterium]